MNRIERGRENENRHRALKNAGVLFLAGVTGCAAVSCALKENQLAAEARFAELAEQTNMKSAVHEPVEAFAQTVPEKEKVSERKEALDALAEPGVPVPEKTVDFPALQKGTNEDIYAWIYIPDTEIDYPVFQHPGDNSYYLNHNLDGSRGYPGCIYTEDYNNKDFSDPDTVLYGHNMKDGAMFAGLRNYSDSEYMEAHPYVYIYTEDGMLVYEIFAAYQAGDGHILYVHDGFKDRKVFEEYIDEIMSINPAEGVLKKGAEVTADSRILTMSTCISGRPENRFLVQGVLLNDRQDAKDTECRAETAVSE